jgi:signal transduction histidine kinase
MQSNSEINKESHGLGLSICYEIAKNLNSELLVDSILKKGSTFTFNLLVEKAKLPWKKPVKS